MLSGIFFPLNAPQSGCDSTSDMIARHTHVSFYLRGSTLSSLVREGREKMRCFFGVSTLLEAFSLLRLGCRVFSSEIRDKSLLAAFPFSSPTHHFYSPSCLLLVPRVRSTHPRSIVIGATFEKHLLLHMLQYDSRDRKEHLHTALLKLIEANFISRSVVGQTERFSFVHTAVQEVIYATFCSVLSCSPSTCVCLKQTILLEGVSEHAK